MADDVTSDCRVSVIIPALNEEKLIERLLKQFDENIRKKFKLEVIVSDGGSTDKTIEIAKKYADKVIRKSEAYLQNISRGRNIGAENSQGDVLIFLNADTLVADAEYVIKESIKEIMENSVSAIACAVYVFPDEEKFSDKAFHFFYNNYTSMLNRFFMGMGRGECHVVSRKNFFESGAYNEKIAAGEDFELYMRIKKSGKVIFRKDFVVYESPRRYRKYGYLRLMWEWGKNSVWVYLFNKSLSRHWEAIR